MLLLRYVGVVVEACWCCGLGMLVLFFRYVGVVVEICWCCS